MSRPTDPVKRTRPYDSSRRRAQSQRRHDLVVEVAEHLFLRDGYTNTTIAAIAGTAEVSADTVYKTFGGKPGLIRAIWRRALQGRGDTPAEERSDQLHDLADPTDIVAQWGE